MRKKAADSNASSNKSRKKVTPPTKISEIPEEEQTLKISPEASEPTPHIPEATSKSRKKTTSTKKTESKTASSQDSQKELEDQARRAVRILDVLRYLQNGWYSVHALSKKLHCSERSIYRDIEDIESALNIQLSKNIRSQYRLISKEGVHFLTLDMTFEEALALYLLCLACGNHYASIPYLDAAQTAIYKLSCLFSEEFRERKHDGTLQRMSIQGYPTAFPSEDGRFFHQILYAHNHRFQVKMEYDSVMEKKTIVTTLLPYHIHFTRRAWYVTGRSTLHNAIRTFHIERIRSLTITDEKFLVPLGWNYEKSLGNAWCMIRGEKDTKVVLRFTPKVAPNVRSVRWHKTGRFVEHPNGFLDYHLEISGLEEIQWWILGYGDQVEVLEPLELREKIIKHVQNMAQLYQI